MQLQKHIVCMTNGCPVEVCILIGMEIAGKNHLFLRVGVGIEIPITLLKISLGLFSHH